MENLTEIKEYLISLHKEEPAILTQCNDFLVELHKYHTYGEVKEPHMKFGYELVRKYLFPKKLQALSYLCDDQDFSKIRGYNPSQSIHKWIRTEDENLYLLIGFLESQIEGYKRPVVYPYTTESKKELVQTLINDLNDVILTKLLNQFCGQLTFRVR